MLCKYHSLPQITGFGEFTSFSLWPQEYHPSGMCNFSLIESQQDKDERKRIETSPCWRCALIDNESLENDLEIKPEPKSICHNDKNKENVLE